MTYLLVAVAFVGAISLFDLVLTFAVLRRLRDQAAEIAVLTASSQRYDPAVLLGREVFEAVAAHDLVGFFDSAFPTCHLDATAFVAEAVDTRALAVIIGDPADIGDLLALLSPVATVLVGDEASAVARAVDIQVFPTFLRVDDGRIGHAATAVAELAEPATAA